MTRVNTSRWMAGAAVMAMMAIAPAVEAQEKSGVASAVNPQAQANLGSGPTRMLAVGNDVIFGERIRTGPVGQVQLLFVDESSLTVGPNSDITIDEFVYDPRAKTGKMSVKMTAGLARFVGGRISKDGNVAITTPTATIGIRGGTGIIQVENAGPVQLSSADFGTSVAQAPPAPSTRAINLFGTMSVRGSGGGGGGEQIISRPGFQVVTGFNQPPGAPGRVDPGQLARINGSLEVSPQAQGGAPGAPGQGGQQQGGQQQAGGPTPGGGQQIDNQFGQSNVGANNSQQQPSSIAPQGGMVRTPGSNAGPTGQSAPLGRANQTAQNATTQNAQNRVTDTVIKPTTTSGTDSSTSGGTFTALVGYLSDDVARGESVTNAKLFSNRVEVTRGGTTLTLPVVAPGETVSQQTTISSTLSGRVVTSRTADGSLFTYTFDISGLGSTALHVGIPTDPSVYQSSRFRVQRFNVTDTFSNAVFGLPSQVSNFTNVNAPQYNLVYRPSDRVGRFSDGIRTAGFLAQLAIDGTGFSQRSAGVTIVGGIFDNENLAGQPSLAAGSRGTYRDSTTDRARRWNVGFNALTDSAGNSFFGGSDIKAFAFNAANGYDDNDRPTVFTGTDAGAISLPDGTTAAINPRGVAALASVQPNTPTNRFNRTLTGYTTGFMQSQAFDAVNATTIGTFGGDNLTAVATTTQFSSITTNADRNRLTASFSLIEQGLNGTWQFGGLTVSGNRSAYIDDQNFAAREAVTSTLTPTSSTSGQQSTFARQYLFTSGSVADTRLPFGSSSDKACTCDFMTWGWWGGEVQYVVNGQQRRDIMHLGSFVMGVQTPVTAIPTSGSASYSGHAVGQVRAAQTVGGPISSYIAAGGFQQSWNFATRTGTATISNFDGRTYSANISSGNGRDVTGSISSNNRIFAIGSSFYSSPTDPVAGVGGKFAVFNTSNQLPTYTATGIVLGQK